MIGAATPPTVTLTDCCGAGKFATAVSVAGACPVARAGETAPAPVMYSAIVWPLPALPVEIATLFESVNTPGAAALTGMAAEAVRPLLFTTKAAVDPAGTSYGIWIFNCVAETYQSGASTPFTVTATPPIARG